MRLGLRVRRRPTAHPSEGPVVHFHVLALVPARARVRRREVRDGVRDELVEELGRQVVLGRPDDDRVRGCGRVRRKEAS
jgi:hypothetical protein